MGKSSTVRDVEQNVMPKCCKRPLTVFIHRFHLKRKILEFFCAFKDTARALRQKLESDFAGGQKSTLLI
jgi:hypothetical protein